MPRPKGPESKVTAVNLNPPMRALNNGEKVERIKAWVNRVNPQKLATNAAMATLKIAHDTGRYYPIKLTYGPEATKGITGNQMSNEGIAIGADEWHAFYKEEKTSIRLPRATHDLILHACDVLGNRPTDVIKMALAEMYLDNGKALGAIDEDNLSNARMELPNLRSKERQNSTMVLRRRKEDLKFWIERYEAEGDEKMAEMKREELASIKA